MQRFRMIPGRIHAEFPFLNITMFGGVGVGKSSFLNTAVTALKNSDEVTKNYRTAPSRTGKSKTKTVSLFISILC